MNTNSLKRFAQEARRKLLEQIGAKMELVLTTDSAEFREKAEHLQKLKEEIKRSSKEKVIDKVAYTWFNRLMALRFMDANEYQPIGMRVVTPKDGYSLPEILDEAKQGHVPDDLPVKKQRIFDILDGRIPSSNAQNEAYKELLIGACNHLNKVFPFLFERINDYAELLLPTDLISEFSIVHDIREGMRQEDCLEVEIIGWLYQFYISEKKDEVFASKKTVKKEDIPAATQLFTPRWIVEYMVQNTVGKLWLQNRPSSKLREHMPYFIESASLKSEEYLKLNSVEELTLLDQACGSGHILVYGFELFAKIYEEEGYNPSEIPQLILEKNLFGFEIDERAAQLAGMALMMKARSYQRRFFSKEIKPNILCFKDLKLNKADWEAAFTRLQIKPSDELNYDLNTLKQATNLGSLIRPHTPASELQKVASAIDNNFQTSDVFYQQQLSELKVAMNQLLLLSKKLHCVVDNPPYMGSGNMNKELGDFVKTNYPDSKADLMACFMEAGLASILDNGYLGMINQHSWMFLSSYERLREKLIETDFIDTLLHLGPRTFPEISGEVVQNASFSIIKSDKVANGSFIRLVDYDSSALKREKTIEAIKNPNCGWFYIANQKDFEKISGSPIGYFLNNSALDIFEKSKSITDLCEIKKGLSTSNNERFLRYFFEVAIDNIQLKTVDINSLKKWFKANKGGEFQKYYGNQEYVLNWQYDGKELNDLKPKSVIRSRKHFFKPILAFSKISSSSFSIRYFEENFISIDASSFLVDIDSKKESYLLGALNSKVFSYLLGRLTPTLNFEIGDMSKFPIPDVTDKQNENIKCNISRCIETTLKYVTSKEVNWHFQKNHILSIASQDIVESFDLYQQFWKNKFFELHKNEEELNRQFIEIYGLQDELTPDVPLEDITILKEETSIENGQLVFHADEVFAQFISYAVGCMFGRFSLDKDGLILANQGETLEDYLKKVEKDNGSVSFLPDDDNIIPVLDDEWFEDDITGRFREFLKVTFGKENLEKNLAFVEECIGKDIRKYFTKDFYNDHIKRYKKRPIYWMFSSPKGSFNVLIYMHRYTPDTLNLILTRYLKTFREKLNNRLEQLEHLIETGSSTQQNKAAKEREKIKLTQAELLEYERDILYPLASERISINLDDGVLVNYNKFGKAIKEVAGLNDKATKKKVKEFDWINTEEIR